MSTCRQLIQHSRTDERNVTHWWQEPCPKPATRGGYCEEHSAGHARRVVEMWKTKARVRERAAKEGGKR